ncbi:MAG: hypothetical protein J1E78_08205, partial [Muribaculaceae bacterium]|nr:hypothetical protein [Muribaculaceae bacterium]
TYKAMNDSAVFNADSYKEFFRKLLGIREPRSVGRKEVVINDISDEIALTRLAGLQQTCSHLLKEIRRHVGYMEFWKPTCSFSKEITFAGEKLDHVVEYLHDCRNNNIVDRLSEFPWIYSTWILDPCRPDYILPVIKWCFPVGYPLYLLSLRERKKLAANLDKTIALSDELASILKEDKN